MLLTSNNNVDLYQFSNLNGRNHIVHFVSARSGGVSKAPFDTLNIGLYVGDDHEAVVENRRRLMAAVGIPMDYLVGAKQIHGDTIVRVVQSLKGYGAVDYSTAIPDTDVLITNEPNLCLFLTVADCVSVFLFDPKKRAIGIVHAGFKGTMKKITLKAVQKMVEEFDCNPKDFIVGIGPSIGPESYEVDATMVTLAKQIFPRDKIILERLGKFYCNLWLANAVQLTSLGVQADNIEQSGMDTFTSTDKFFSDRHDRPTGRFMTAIMLKE